jgi:hypothetical protein
MSIFHSTFAFFKKVFTSEPSWTKTAQVAIAVVAPLAESLAVYAGGAHAGSDAASIVHTVQTDLGIVNATLAQLHGQPANAGAAALLKNALQSIKDNLPGLLELAAVKNPNSKEAATLAVTTIVGELDAILSVIPAVIPAA